MPALAKHGRRLSQALTEAERAVMAAMADLFETADQVTVSRSRVALVLDARKVDRLHELLDIATSDGGREPGSDDDEAVDDAGCDEDTDREEQNEDGDDMGGTDRGFVGHAPFELEQASRGPLLIRI